MFKKIFKKNKIKNKENEIFLSEDLMEENKDIPATEEKKTAPLTKEQIEALTHEDNKNKTIQISSASGYHVGRVRKNNEDAVFYFSSFIAANNKQTPFGLYIVSDGMGGHENGELASEIAVKTLSHSIIQKMYSAIFGIYPQKMETSLKDIMEDGIKEAHTQIYNSSIGGGATLTAALIFNQQYIIGHVGDSRAYSIYLDGRMQKLTRDHSLIERMKEMGQLTAEEAENHPQKSMLYRALGQMDVPEVDVITGTMPSHGYILLCTDGLWGMINDDEIFSIVTKSTNPQNICDELVQAANAAGGNDNIGIVLVQTNQI